jgi:ubiquitin-conjugating enzyme E2 S
MSTTENLPPSVTRNVLREIRKLAKAPPAGVRHLPRGDSTSEIYAEIEGPADTPFFGGHFVVKLVVDSSFPRSPPRGFFITKIFHPNVATSGAICVNALKKDWNPGLGLSHVLKIIWCLLLVPFPESSLNAEAGKLFMESYQDYFKKAAMMTKIYACDSNATSQSSYLSSDVDSAQSNSAPKSLKSKSPNRPMSTRIQKKTKKRRSPHKSRTRSSSSDVAVKRKKLIHQAVDESSCIDGESLSTATSVSVISSIVVSTGVLGSGNNKSRAASNKNPGVTIHSPHAGENSVAKISGHRKSMKKRHRRKSLQRL